MAESNLKDGVEFIIRKAPVNFVLNDEQIVKAQKSIWEKESELWKKANEGIGNSLFSGIVIKASYVMGLLHSLFESVDTLSKKKQEKELTFFPAFSVFASAIDLFGRCIKGERTEYKSCVKIGFQSVLDYNNKKEINTSTNKYDATDLTSLRNFAAHGIATNSNVKLKPIMADWELLKILGNDSVKAFHEYWESLKTTDTGERCMMLAQANILIINPKPILNSWMLFEKNDNGEYESIEIIFKKFDWIK